MFALSVKSVLEDLAECPPDDYALGGVRLTLKHNQFGGCSYCDINKILL